MGLRDTPTLGLVWLLHLRGVHPGLSPKAFPLTPKWTKLSVVFPTPSSLEPVLALAELEEEAWWLVGWLLQGGTRIPSHYAGHHLYLASYRLLGNMCDREKTQRVQSLRLKS